MSEAVKTIEIQVLRYRPEQEEDCSRHEHLDFLLGFVLRREYFSLYRGGIRKCLGGLLCLFLKNISRVLCLPCQFCRNRLHFGGL